VFVVIIFDTIWVTYMLYAAPKDSPKLGSKTPPPTRRGTVGKDAPPIRRSSKEESSILRSSTDDGLIAERLQQAGALSFREAGSTSSPLLRNTSNRQSGGTPSGVNQIFYGKEELIKLLLELDEFD